MKRHLVPMLMVLTLLFTSLVPPAHAALQRSGPIDPANGYPAWYQDTTGLALEFCQNLDQAELNRGWCLLLPPDPATAPEVFPGNFNIEHFYWAANAGSTKVAIPGVTGNTVVLLVMALEGSFANGVNVVPGDQNVFARMRFKVNPVPFDGTYTFYTPFGKFVFPDQKAGQVRGLFVTQDIGLSALDFGAPLRDTIGPFLLPSPFPGGPEMPPLTATNPTPDTNPANFGGVFAPTPYPGTGKSYVADIARIGPVTGSLLPDYTFGDGTTGNANVFRVEVLPAGSATPIVLISTNNFNLQGRIFEGAIAGDLHVDRASYAASAAGNKVDVYATGAPSTQGRLPAGPAPATVATQMAYYDAACTPTLDAAGNPGPPFSAPAAGVANQMFASGSHYYGQSHPAILPTEVCIQANAVNTAGQTVQTFLPAPLGDQVFITEALFDPASQSLSVKATSSDQVTPQTLTVEGLGTINPATGQLLVNPLLAPPDTVTVLSTGRGVNQYQVSTGAVAGGVAVAPVAINDTASVLENCSPTATTAPCATPVVINVLANDTNATGGIVSLASSPILGTAVVNADGTISYTPKLFAFGTDSFTYHVTVGTQVSNAASVTVTITHVNQLPVANPDILNAIANIPASLNVLANDTDPDGLADIVAVANVSAVTPAPGTAGTATAVASGRTVTFTATATGSYTFTYQAQDAAGALSNPATVTVTVSPAETLTITKSIFTVSKGRLVVSGTITPDAGQTITIDYLNSAGTVIGRAGSVVEAAGAWTLDQLGLTLPTGASRVRAISSNGSVATATITLK